MTGPTVLNEYSKHLVKLSVYTTKLFIIAQTIDNLGPYANLLAFGVANEGT